LTQRAYLQVRTVGDGACVALSRSRRLVVGGGLPTADQLRQRVAITFAAWPHRVLGESVRRDRLPQLLFQSAALVNQLV